MIFVTAWSVRTPHNWMRVKGQPKIPDFFHESVEGMITKTSLDLIDLHSHEKSRELSVAL